MLVIEKDRYTAPQQLPSEMERLVGQPEQVTQDCESVWNRTLQLWSSTDALVAQLIAHTKGGQQELFQIDEDRTKQIELECEDLARVRHECSKQDCKKDIEDLLKIVVRNMWKIKPKQDTTSQEKMLARGWQPNTS